MVYYIVLSLSLSLILSNQPPSLCLSTAPSSNLFVYLPYIDINYITVRVLLLLTSYLYSYSSCSHH